MLRERRTEHPPLFERVHSLADSPILLKDGSLASANQLAERFYTSEIGSSMPDQPLRYVGRFGYDRDAMLEDLGHDLCSIGHQKELAFHLGEIIEREMSDETLYGSMDEKDIAIVMLAALVHDIGEATHPLIEQAHTCWPQDC